MNEKKVSYAWKFDPMDDFTNSIHVPTINGDFSASVSSYNKWQVESRREIKSTLY